jgi:hypothetical protein
VCVVGSWIRAAHHLDFLGNFASAQEPQPPATWFPENKQVYLTHTLGYLGQEKNVSM